MGLLANIDADRADVTTHFAEARKMTEEALADTSKILPGSHRTEVETLTQQTSAWAEAVAGRLPTLLLTVATDRYS